MPVAVWDVDSPDGGRRWAAAATVLFVIVGIALRWTSLTRESFWLDEGFTAWVAGQTPARILRIIRADTNPPLYYFLVHYWISLFGDSETAFRSFSALCATVSIALVYLLAKRMLQKPWAVAAAVGLLCISAFQIDYAHDTRFYALLSMLSLLSLYGARRFLDRRREGKFSRWGMAAVVLGTAAGLYTHNMMLLYLPLLNLVWLMLPEGPGLRRRILDLLLADALIALLYLPWVTSLLGQVHRVGSNFWVARPAIWQLVEVISILCGVDNDYTRRLVIETLGDLGIQIHAFTAHPYLAGWPARALVAGAVGVAVVWAAARLRKKGSGDVLALAIYALVPVLALFALSRWGGRPLLLNRTLIASSGPLALLLASPLAYGAKRRWVCPVYAIVVALIAAAAVISVAIQWRDGRREDWRGAYAYVRELKFPPGEQRLLVFVSADGEPPFDYYAQRDGKVIPPDQQTGVPLNFLTGDLPGTEHRVTGPAGLAGLRAQLDSGRYRHIIFLHCFAWSTDPDDLALKLLRQTCTLRDERDFAHGLEVYHFIAPGEPPSRDF